MFSVFVKRPGRTILVLLLMTVFGLATVYFSRGHNHVKKTDNRAVAILREAYSAVLKNYVEKPDSKALTLKMVDGMLAALDPHSAYLPPEPYHEMEMQISGAFGGVGIELGTKEGKLTVIAPIDDTPAFRAGILANDHIWKIDGSPTTGMNIAAAVKRMRGEKGTSVTLTILRAENGKPFVFKLVRDIIRIKSVKPKLLDSGVGLIRISQFQERTGADFKEALKELHVKAGGVLKGLILDLRYNPGGLLNSSVEVVNCFVGEDISNSVIVSTRGRAPDSNRIFNGSLGVKEPHYPMVVLINGGSASASEIVAGALQDHKRAVVMGTTSFGKGSVQSIIPMKGNAALKLTTARYYTPRGRSIQAKGIVPDIEVSAIKDVTPQPEKNRQEIKEKDLHNRLAPQEKPDTVPHIAPLAHGTGASLVDQDLQKDFQLRRALELLQSLAQLKERGFGPQK